MSSAPPIARLSQCLLLSIVECIECEVLRRAPANQVTVCPVVVAAQATAKATAAKKPANGSRKDVPTLLKPLQIYGWFYAHLPVTKRLRGHRGELNAVVQCGDGSLVSCADDHRVLRWSAKGKERVALNSKSPLYPNAIAVLGDGQTIAVGNEIPAVIELYDTKACTKLCSLRGHHDWVWALAVVGGEALLASASDDHTVSLWDCQSFTIHNRESVWQQSALEEGAEMDTEAATSLAHPKTAIQHGHRSKVRALVALGEQGCSLASGDDDGIVIISDIQDYVVNGFAARKATHLRRRTQVHVCHLCALGDTLAASYGDKLVILWHVNTSQRLIELETRHEPRCMAWLCDGWLAVADGARIKIWQNFGMGDGDGRPRCFRTLYEHSDRVRTLAVVDGGNTLASGAGDDTILLWDTSFLLE